MSEFTASNGSRVAEVQTVDDGARLTVYATRAYNKKQEGGTTTAYLIDDQVQALREFFQDERDQELGRWRWPENPEYVVYPGSLELRFGGAVRGVTVLSEQIPRVYTVWEDSVDTVYGTSANEAVRQAARQAARAYFDAHPEPKPWHDAQEGDVWVLTLDDGEVEWERAASFHGGRFHTSNGGTVPLDGDNPDAWAQITDARRIWPEDER